MAGNDAVAVVGGVLNSDWICGDTDCHHVNFARRTKCNRCQRERSPETSSISSAAAKKKLVQEIGKAAAEKSRGLFSAEDWQCNKCLNVNWSRRQNCNMCNAPKFTDVEERTGYGGGYNDRGVVEYKEREESDSEYDEFGRLKKRKKNASPNNFVALKEPKKEKLDEVHVEKKPAIVAQKYEEEEEDDDDDDDENGDLSKYDLWGDADDDEDEKDDIKPLVKLEKCDSKKSNNNSNKKEKDRHSSSRSRSRTSSSSSSSTSSSSTSSRSSSTSSSHNSSSSSSHSDAPKKPSSSYAKATPKVNAVRKTRSPSTTSHSSTNSAKRRYISHDDNKPARSRGRERDRSRSPRR